MASLLWPIPELPSPRPLAAQETVAVRGQVVDQAAERPIPGVRVVLVEASRETLTDRDGTFRLPGVIPGTYTLRLEAMGYRIHEEALEVGPGLAPVTLSLARRALALPEVIATGTPLRGVAPYQPGQALGREELAARAADSFGQMLDGEPGVAMRSLGPVTGRPVIRGLDGDRVAVLENGQRMGDMAETAHDHAVAMEPLTADRVEVVRGPASLLYGSSALGGVVNLLRRDIPSDWSPGLSGTGAAQLASVNRMVAGAGSAEYGMERWAVSARGSFRDGSDFRAPGTPAGVLESTHNRLITGGAGVGWEGRSLRGGISVDGQDHVFGIPEELDDPDEGIEIRSRRYRASGLAEWRRPEGHFRNVEVRGAVARYHQREVDTELGPEGTAEEEIPHDFRRTTADLGVTAVHGSAGPFRAGAVGASLMASELNARGIEEFHPDGRSWHAGVFTFHQAPLDNRLDLLVGARLEHGRTRAFGNPMFPGFSAERRATTASGALGLSARPGDGWEVGGQLARAHRAPLLEQLYSDGPHVGAGRFEIGDPDLGNEVGHGVDLFARYGGERLRAEVALFGNRIRDFVFPRNTGEVHEPSGFPVVRWTASKADFLGGEASLEALLSRTVRVRATADYVRGAQRDEERTPLPFIPPLRGSLETRYDPGPWWVGVKARSAARQSRVPLHQEATDGYALLDLQAGLRLNRDGGHLLILRVENTLDTVYRDHLSRVDERRFPMPGRNLSVVYRRSF